MNTPSANQPVELRRHRTRILVLGASGRLGSALRHRHSSEKSVERSVDMIWQTRRAGPANHSGLEKNLVWDILNQDLPSGISADIVLCLAGVVNGDAAALSVNSDLARAALNAGQKIGARRVFLTSSAAVYGAGPFAEDTDPRPISQYGHAKLEMERVALSWRKNAPEGAPKLTILRVGNVAGSDSVLGQGRRHVKLDTGPSGQPLLRSYIGPNRLSDMLLDLSQMAASGESVPQFLNVALSSAISLKALLQNAGWSFSEIRNAGLNPIEVALQTQRLARLGLRPERNAQVADILDDLKNREARHDVA